MTSPHTLLKAWELRARKELGQNFLKDPSLAEKIVNMAGIGPEDVVLEIGAGLGAMTVAIARRAGRTIAVEKDRQLIPLLKAELLLNELDTVQILEENILALDLPRLAAEADRPLLVLGNLPYNISSQVLVKLIKDRHLVRRAVLMFQKELAERLIAGPGSKTYGRLSVLLQYCADLTILREVNAEMFFPKPKVGSVVLGIDFKTRIDPQVQDETLLSRVVQAAFGQRRKTLRNALSAGLPVLGQAGAQAVLQGAGIDPQRRAETLSVQEFIRLTDQVTQHTRDPQAP